ncbi:hypothetical protein QJS04_geneDACA000844 [Acorus gramineus]|uniref:HMA domain-containing protein n=1 Tax=Acorus gramineus TaxID=55184 RepID=A0AAV9BED1_ACOGR|nr:hypothetical protein QJS04_geneDACA000844 [Acorus gramineus]
MTIIEMCVHMDCAGCESKIKKALQKLEGVDSIEIDMAMQKVTVTGWVEQKKVLKAVRKTGRRAELWPYPYNPEFQPYNQHQNQIQGGYNRYSYAAPASSYNYYKHGYDGGYYQGPSHSNVVGDQTRSMFSDENPNACSIM